jgi:hypothetical protein
MDRIELAREFRKAGAAEANALAKCQRERGSGVKFDEVCATDDRASLEAIYRAVLTNPKIILYRGAPMREAWPELIRHTQGTATLTIGGMSFPRIRYGGENGDWGADGGPCHDCGVNKGEIQVHGCDVEECPCCGGQLIGCCPRQEWSRAFRQGTVLVQPEMDSGRSPLASIAPF